MVTEDRRRDGNTERQHHSKDTGYEAPIVVPEVTQEVLEIFDEPAYSAQTYRDEDQVTYTVTGRDPDASAGEVQITHKQQEGQGRITLSGTPAVGSGISMSISGNASDWILAQSVDDHNLLTELVYQGEAVLSIYGPPAKLRLTEITIDGDGGNSLIVSKKHWE